MEENWLWYLSGAFDTSGVMTAHIQKRESRSTGYEFRPKISIMRQPSKQSLFNMIEDYCDEQEIRYRVEQPRQTNSVKFIVDTPEGVKKFLTPIKDGFIQQRKQANVMLNEIIPAVKEGKHNTKEGFYELIGHVETLRETISMQRGSKYTQQYFEDLWDLD